MGGPFEGQPGPLRFQAHNQWRLSDDSQLTLATCESIIAVGKVSPEHIADQFVQWYRARRITGMGASTLKALRDLDAGIHWAMAGAKGEMAAGTGAAMRMAPLAFHLDPGIHRERQTFRDVCRITHHNEESYVGALAIALAIRFFAFDELSPKELLRNLPDHLPDSRVRDRIQQLSEISPETAVADVANTFGSSGYVVEAVPLALYSTRLIDSVPLDVVLQSVIETGGDTDTIASMSGQIVGARIGASQISQHLSESVPNMTNIDRLATNFAATVQK